MSTSSTTPPAVQAAGPLSDQRLAEIRALAERAAARPFLFADCEGVLKVWAVSALKHVNRDEAGEITGWSEPGSYTAADLVTEVELDMDTWDPGEDMDDDQRRTDVGDLVASRDAVPALLAEVDRLRAELAKYVGQEPTLAEEALYAHEEQVRQRIAQDVHRADRPVFAKTEDPELVVKTTRAIDVHLIELGPAAPYWVPEAGDGR